MMRSTLLGMFCLLMIAAPAMALEIFDTSYQVEVYASYTNAASSNNMCVDSDGNLYILHYDNGNIMKVDTNGSSSLFATAQHPYDITWGGGTAFGNSLYITNRGNSSISKVNSNGQIAYLGHLTYGTFLTIDSVGNYGGEIFAGTSDLDKIYKYDTNGTRNTFTSWPEHTNGGGPYGGDFDTNGKFNNMLYVASSFAYPNLAYKSGVFSIDTEGNVARASNSIVRAYDLDFDKTGKYFDGDMLVRGKDTLDGDNFIFKLDEFGNATKLFGDMRNYCFGMDGALYINEYNFRDDITTVYRVVPEPTTIAIIALGGLMLRRRR